MMNLICLCIWTTSLSKFDLFTQKFGSLINESKNGSVRAWCFYWSRFHLVCVPHSSSSIPAYNSFTILIFSLIAVSLWNFNSFYIKAKMVFCYQNCSDLLRDEKFFEITRTIYCSSERLKNLWWRNAFLTCSWRFLVSNKLEQFRFKLEQIIGI